MITQRLSMITGEDDDRIVPLTGPFQTVENPGELIIDLFDHGVVERLLFSSVECIGMLTSGLKNDILQRLLLRQVALLEMGANPHFHFQAR